MKKASVSISPLLLFKNVMTYLARCIRNTNVSRFLLINVVKITDAVRSEAAQQEAPETETITQFKSPLNALHFPFRPDEYLKA